MHNDWSAVVHKLRRAQQKWSRMSRVLIRESAGIIYVVVVQAVLLYRSETWVMKLHIGRFWGGLHHRVAHRLTERQPQRRWDGEWLYNPLAEATIEAGLQEVETYVSCRQNTVIQFISTRPILDLCLAVERHPGSREAYLWL